MFKKFNVFDFEPRKGGIFVVVVLSFEYNNLTIRKKQLTKKAYASIAKNEEKSLMLLGNILQNNPNAIKQINVETFVKHLIENIRVSLFHI